MDLTYKQRGETRQALMDAAVAELAAGRTFGTLSLREVAKLAGIAPTSFYRHFHSMEELGLALIREHGEVLLELMHQARNQGVQGQTLIRSFVEILFDHFDRNRGMSRMIMQESMSGHMVFREAAEELFTTMSGDLADFFIAYAAKNGIQLSHPHLAANSIVAVLFTTGISLLNTPTEDRNRHVEAVIVQLTTIMRGSEVDSGASSHWYP